MPRITMLPFEQGGLDSLCGIYSLVNAERLINNTSVEDSQKLFNKIIEYLGESRLLASIFTEGMILKYMKAILVNVMGHHISYQKVHFAGVTNPDLDSFWEAISSFLAHQRVVILCMSGVHDHWSVVKEISDKRIDLFDSNGLYRLNRINCTTSNVRGSRHHVFHPAQTFFLKNS